MPGYASDNVCMPRKKMGGIAPISPRVEHRIGNNQMPRRVFKRLKALVASNAILSYRDRLTSRDMVSLDDKNI